MSLDIKDYFLQIILNYPEYLRIHGKYFLNDIRSQYNINAIAAPDDYVYHKVKRGTHELIQSTRLARDQLIKHIQPFGYSPSKYAPNISAHDTRPTKKNYVSMILALNFLSRCITSY